MANCDNCTINKAEPVPFIVHEGIMVRMERTIKRLWIVVLVLVFVLIASNGAWLWYESQFEYFTTTVEQDAENGINNYIGNDGDIINGDEAISEAFDEEIVEPDDNNDRATA